VVPTADAKEFAEQFGAESHQIVDTYSYEPHEIESPTDDQVREDEALAKEHTS